MKLEIRIPEFLSQLCQLIRLFGEWLNVYGPVFPCILGKGLYL
jgi:hypothetical protein